MQSGLMIIKQGRHKRHTRSHSNDTKLLFSFQTTSHKTKPYPVYTYVAILTNQTSFILNANIIINVQTPDITTNKYLSKPTKQVRLVSQTKYSNIENVTT